MIYIWKYLQNVYHFTLKPKSMQVGNKVLTHKQLETLGCILSIVLIVLDLFHAKMLHLLWTASGNKIMF